ncbi:MAG TPA: hypothetical protein VHA78_05580 [Candidatus Peribacteraceae bacterium]|nr:hypothetical protein [Candidatus Peribacteraceae bacterium]
MRHTHTHHRNKFSARENRMIFRGPEQNSGKEQPSFNEYKKDKGLKEYASTMKKHFQEQVGKLEQKLQKSEHAKYAKNMKEYVHGSFAEWLDKYAQGQLNDSIQLENGLRKVEESIAKMEAFAVEETGRREDVLLNGKTYIERQIEHAQTKASQNGVESTVLVDGTHVMDVPEDWKFQIDGLMKINSDPSRPYSQDISGGRKRFAFKAAEGTIAHITIPSTGAKMDIPLTKGEGGGLKIDIPGHMRKEFAAKEKELQVVTDGLIDRFNKSGRSTEEKAANKPARQQDPKLAEKIVTSLRDELALVRNYEAYLDPKAVSPKVRHLLQGIDAYSRETDQKLMQTAMIDLREGREKDAQATIKRIEESFNATYGNDKQALKEFIENNAAQLDRDDMPYRIKIDTYKDGKLKLAVIKNQEYKKGREQIAKKQNREKAARKLIDAFKVESARFQADNGGDAAKALLHMLEQKTNAGDMYGMYVDAEGNLWERDTTWTGADEKIYPNFKDALLKDPLNVLQTLAKYNADTLEREEAKSAVKKTAENVREYYEERTRTPEEIEQALTLVGVKMKTLRKAIAGGTVTEAYVKQEVSDINSLLKLDIRGIDYLKRVNSALGDMSEVVSKDGRSYYEFSYNDAKRQLAVKRVRASGFGGGIHGYQAMM